MRILPLNLEEARAKQLTPKKLAVLIKNSKSKKSQKTEAISLK